MGKTTSAAAFALAEAGPGRRVLLVSTDPAHSLGEALGVPLGPEPRRVPGAPGLSAAELVRDRAGLRLDLLDERVRLVYPVAPPEALAQEPVFGLHVV